MFLFYQQIGGINTKKASILEDPFSSSNMSVSQCLVDAHI